MEDKSIHIRAISSFIIISMKHEINPSCGVIYLMYWILTFSIWISHSLFLSWDFQRFPYGDENFFETITRIFIINIFSRFLLIYVLLSFVCRFVWRHSFKVLLNFLNVCYIILRTFLISSLWARYALCRSGKYWITTYQVIRKTVIIKI